MYKIMAVIMCVALATETGLLGMIIEKIKIDSGRANVKTLRIIIMALFLAGTVGSIMTMTSIVNETNSFMKLIIFAIFVSQLTGVFISIVVLHKESTNINTKK